METQLDACHRHIARSGRRRNSGSGNYSVARAWNDSWFRHDPEARDQIDWNPEWSRRARGFPTYAALRQLGRQGVAELIEQCCRHASALVSQIGELSGTEILAEPIINQGVVRFPSRPGASEQDHDRRTDEVIAALASSGEAFFTGSTWRGRRVMRVSVCNWRTDEADVARAINALWKILTTGKVATEGQSPGVQREPEMQDGPR